jgi:hypothetical protein
MHFPDLADDVSTFGNGAGKYIANEIGAGEVTY